MSVRAVTTVGVLAAGAVGLAAGPALAAYQPTHGSGTVSRSVVKAGSAVTFCGGGFLPKSAVIITVDGRVVRGARSNGAGRFCSVLRLGLAGGSAGLTARGAVADGSAGLTVVNASFSTAAPAADTPSTAVVHSLVGSGTGENRGPRTVSATVTVIGRSVTGGGSGTVPGSGSGSGSSSGGSTSGGSSGGASGGSAGAHRATSGSGAGTVGRTAISGDVAPESGGLPFTGTELAGMVTVALVLAGSGVGLRVAGRHRSDSA